MALKPCRECKKKVSTEALTCPNCGVPDPTVNLETKYEIVWCEEISCKSRHKQLKIPTILLGQQQCPVCESVMTLVSKKQLAQLETIKKYLEPHKKKVSDLNKREAAEKKIIDKHYGGRSADDNVRESVSKGNGFWNGTEGLAKTFWLYFIVGNMIGNLMVLGAASEGMGLVYFVGFVTVVWNIFAIMGVFNAADIYKAEKIKIGTTYGYATAAKISCVVLILSSIGNAL